jgi:hypothetical protein
MILFSCIVCTKAVQGPAGQRDHSELDASPECECAAGFIESLKEERDSVPGIFHQPDSFAGADLIQKIDGNFLWIAFLVEFFGKCIHHPVYIAAGGDMPVQIDVRYSMFDVR